MAINISPIGKPAKKGGGGLGKLLGLGAGIAATVATGGAAAPAILAGASTGAGLGGMIGDAINPGEAAQQGAQVKTSNEPISRRLEQSNAQSNMRQLRDAAIALPELPPEQRQQYAEPIIQAYGAEAQKLKRGGM